jgi:X-Pro dipeptidyl-peptidase
MTLSRTRRVAFTALVAAAIAAPITPFTHADATTTTEASTAASAATSTPYKLDNGVTAPVYSYADAIRESVWVIAPDLDGDGQPDRIGVDIIRPSELDGTAQIPVIMDASPYYACCGRGNESELKEYDANGNPTKFPLFYDNYFVPRGYAYAAIDMAGTNRSTGCSDEGAESDILSIKAVVDWLNGRATAVDATGNPVTAGWTNGDSALIGKSYDGTLANGVAATGVEGLKTIVPISAISSWYDYDRYQGIPFSYDYPTFLSSYVERNRTEPVNCDAINDQLAADDGDETGAYTDFWSRRDYREAPLPAASAVTASVFISHGLQDTNVKGPNFSRWWKALGDNGVTRKMWLSRLGHVDPFDYDRARWVDTLHRWFDSQLYGIDNGILDEPKVDVEVRPNQWVTSNRWPLRTGTTMLHPQSDGTLGPTAAQDATAAFTNDPTQRESKAITEGPNGSRLLYTTGPLANDTRLSGTSEVRLDVTTEVPTGQVGVFLVDYGTDERVLTSGDGATNLTTESCYGESTAEDDACYIDVTRNLGTTQLQTLARGWARLDGAGRHRVTVELTPQDNVLSQGHRLGLVVVATSRDWVVRLDTTTSTYTVGLDKTSLVLPGAVTFSAAAPGAVSRAQAVPSRGSLTPGSVPTQHGRQLPY